MVVLQDAHERAAAGGDHRPLLNGDAHKGDPQDLAVHVGEHGTCVLYARHGCHVTGIGDGDCAWCMGRDEVRLEGCK